MMRSLECKTAEWFAGYSEVKFLGYPVDEKTTAWYSISVIQDRAAPGKL